MYVVRADQVLFFHIVMENSPFATIVLSEDTAKKVRLRVRCVLQGSPLLYPHWLPALLVLQEVSIRKMEAVVLYVLLISIAHLLEHRYASSVLEIPSRSIKEFQTHALAFVPKENLASLGRIPMIYPGFWRVPQSLGIVHQCIPFSSCQDTGINITTTCDTGYQGKRCGECSYPQYFHFDNVCKMCGDWKTSSSVVIALLILLALILLNGISQRRNVSPMDLHIILYCVQIIALYPQLSHAWPPVVKSFLDSASIFVSFVISPCSCLTSYHRTSIWTTYSLGVFSLMTSGLPTR
jgi:hypothetical protein